MEYTLKGYVFDFKNEVYLVIVKYEQKYISLFVLDTSRITICLNQGRHALIIFEGAPMGRGVSWHRMVKVT